MKTLFAKLPTAAAALLASTTMLYAAVGPVAAPAAAAPIEATHVGR